MKQLYVIYDRVAEEASPPFVAHNDLIGKRMMKQSLIDNPAPDDFRLYRIASLKDNGFIDPETVLKQPEEIL